MLRTLLVFLLPTAALADGAACGVVDGGPLFGGPRAVVGIRMEDYPAGQEVALEIYATPDRPGAERAGLGRTKKAVGGGGKVRLSVISDPLPDTQAEWKVEFWYSPRVGTNEVNFMLDYTLRRAHLTPK